MTQQHKDALKQGRQEAKAIKEYLGALESRKPGRPQTRDSIERRLADLEAKIAASDDRLKSVELVQKRLDLEDELKHLDAGRDLETLEADFVRHALSYSERKSISYTAWREIGVPAATLRKAGIAETRRR